MLSIPSRDTKSTPSVSDKRGHFNFAQRGHYGFGLTTPGRHSDLIREIIEAFAPRFAPGAEVIYVGDTGTKTGFFDALRLAKLGVAIDKHGKMPDAILYHANKDWLFLVECVTSHGPVDAKRHGELAELFEAAEPGLVYVTAFPTRRHGPLSFGHLVGDGGVVRRRAKPPHSLRRRPLSRAVSFRLTVAMSVLICRFRSSFEATQTTLGLETFFAAS